MLHLQNAPIVTDNDELYRVYWQEQTANLYYDIMLDMRKNLPVISLKLNTVEREAFCDFSSPH